MFGNVSCAKESRDSQEIYDKYCKGVKEAPAKDFEYVENSDGTITISKYKKKGNKSSFIIPSYINGKKVTELGYVDYSEEDYEGEGVGLCGKVVIIPDTIETINPFAFNGEQRDYEILLIGKNVKEIYDKGVGPSGKNFEFKGVIVHPKNKNYYSKNGSLFLKSKKGDALLYCYLRHKQRTVKIPDNVVYIESYCLHSRYLRKIILGKKVKYLSCRDTVTYENNVLDFNDEAQISEIAVVKGNKNYYSVGGVLFRRKDKALVEYPKGKKKLKYIIPEGTERIASYAFNGNKYLERVVFPDSVKRIDDYAFVDCDNLASIVIPEAVDYIERRAIITSKIKKIVFKDKDSWPCAFSWHLSYNNDEQNPIVFWIYKDSAAEAYLKYFGYRYKYLKSE